MVAPTAVPAGNSTTQSYDKLCERLKELSNLNAISGLLGWDEVRHSAIRCCRALPHARSALAVDRLPSVWQLVMMPKKAADARASQKAALAGVLYDKARQRPLQAPLRHKR